MLLISQAIAFFSFQLDPCKGGVQNTTSQSSQKEVNSILAAVKPVNCILDSYQSWLVKASGDNLHISLIDIINLSLISGTFTGSGETTPKVAIFGSAGLSKISSYVKVAESSNETIPGLSGWYLYPGPILFCFHPVYRTKIYLFVCLFDLYPPSPSWQAEGGSGRPHRWPSETSESKQVRASVVTQSESSVQHCQL